MPLLNKQPSVPQMASANDLQTIVQGRDAVSEHLENGALKRTNVNPGVHALQRDDAGHLVLYYAGHVFTGSGTISFGGALLDVIEARSSSRKDCPSSSRRATFFVRHEGFI
jgi:hypothetical protein